MFKYNTFFPKQSDVLILILLIFLLLLPLHLLLLLSSRSGRRRRRRRGIPLALRGRLARHGGDGLERRSRVGGFAAGACCHHDAAIYGQTKAKEGAKTGWTYDVSMVLVERSAAGVTLCCCRFGRALGPIVRHHTATNHKQSITWPSLWIANIETAHETTS